MVRVICDCNVGYGGERFPKGQVCDLPDDVVLSLGGRAVRVPDEPEPAVAFEPAPAAPVRTRATKSRLTG